MLATDVKGRRLNVEILTSVPSELPQRLTYCAAASFTGLLDEAPSYQTPRPSITICVLSGALSSSQPSLHLDFRMRDSKSNLAATDDFQIRILQLQHLQITAESVWNATPMEQWAYFLANVQTMTIEDVQRLFPDRVFQEAFGVLEMISETEAQLLAYHARMKQQYGEEGRLLPARLDGEARGVEIGRIRGRVSLLQERLGLRVWTAEEFAACDDAQLKVMSEQLETKLRTRES